jgi:arsenate reductase
MTIHRSKVLFLSTGDASRSLIAEGFLGTLSGDQFDVVTVGLKPSALNPLATDVMAEVGIDISRQETESVAQSFKERFLQVITICDTDKERNPIFPFALRILHWSIVDPTLGDGSPGDKARAFRHVRDEICAKVHRFVAEIGKINASQLSIA